MSQAKGRYITKKYNNPKGFGLSEILIAVMLIGMVVSVAVYVIVQAFILISTSKQRVLASNLADEQMNAVVASANENWQFIKDNTGINGSDIKNLTFSSTSTITGTTAANGSTTIIGVGTLFTTQLSVGDIIALSSNTSATATVNSIASDTSITISQSLGNGSSQTIVKNKNGYTIANGTKVVVNSGTSYTVGFTIDRTYKTLAGAFSTSTSDYEDPHYRLITVNVSWTDINSKTTTTNIKTYLNDYDLSKITFTTFYDFRRGNSLTSTYVTNDEGGANSGEVSLAKDTTTTYQLSGTYISQIVDLGATSSIHNVNFVMDMPSLSQGFNFSLQGGNSVNTMNTSPAWTGATCNLLPPSSGITNTYSCNISITGVRYLQYRMIMSTTINTNTQTPLLRSVSIFYQ